MGYYTSYSLDFYGKPEEVEKAKNDLLEISKDDDGEVDFELRQLIRHGGVNAKLYDIDEWIEGAAKDNPNVLIVLSGDGEESGDVWEERWKGELFELREPVMPPLKNKELETPNNN